VFVFSSYDCIFSDLDFEFVRAGLWMYTACFLNHITDVRLVASAASGGFKRARLGVGHALASGLNYYEHLDLTGSPVIFIGALGGTTATNVWCSLDPDGILGMFFRAADNTNITLVNPSVSDEGLAGTGVRAAVGFSNVWTAAIHGGDFQVQGTAVPLIISDSAVSNTATLTATGVQFEPHVAATEIVRIQGSNPAAVTLVGPYQSLSSPAPWSLSPQTLTVLGRGEQLPNRTVTTTYAVKIADHTVRADATGGAFSVTLPTAVGVAGKRYVVKKIDSSGNAVTVATTSAQTIDGAASYSLATQYKFVVVESDGANWIVVGNN
jgi:hypothetical protein